MIPNYDLGNRTPVTIENLVAFGFSCDDEEGFTVCSWGEYDKNEAVVCFTNGILESISVFYIFELGNTRETNQIEVVDKSKLNKCTVETLLWLIDVFLEEKEQDG